MSRSVDARATACLPGSVCNPSVLKCCRRKGLLGAPSRTIPARQAGLPKFLDISHKRNTTLLLISTEPAHCAHLQVRPCRGGIGPAWGVAAVSIAYGFCHQQAALL